MGSKSKMVMSEDACRVCGKEDDEAFLVLCDGCDNPFHTYCHIGCVCCNLKPKNNFNRRPAVPEGDWFCKFCAGHLPKLEDNKDAISSVFVWGDNEDGQLGLPELEAAIVWEPSRVRQLDGTGVLGISSMETSTLLLSNDGNIYSAGTGGSGQLGHQDMVHEKLKKFRKIEVMMEEKRSRGEGRIAKLSCGKDFAYALTSEGHVYSWGQGELGQLGHQENKNKKVPKKMSALRELEIPIDLVACGQDFAFLTSKDSGDDDQFNTKRPGVVMSVGANTNGQLADGSSRNQWVPQLLNKDAAEFTNPNNGDILEPSEFLLGRDISQIAAGKAHCVAVTRGTSSLWTWGYGELGQLGHPKPPVPEAQSKFFRPQFRVPRPRFVQALKGKIVHQVVCGGNHTLVLLQSGAVYGMGSNEFGQVGVALEKGAEKQIVELPTELKALTTHKIKQIGAGEDFSVALTVEGAVFTWGRGQYGQLGLGENTAGPLDTPSKVEKLPRIITIYVGPNQVFAVEFTNDTPLPSTRPATTATATKKRGRPPAASATGSAKKKTASKKR